MSDLSKVATVIGVGQSDYVGDYDRVQAGESRTIRRSARIGSVKNLGQAACRFRVDQPG